MPTLSGGAMARPAGSVVVVRWHDAGSASTPEEAARIVRESVGFLIRENRKGIWLSMEPDALSAVHFIPRGMILGSAVVSAVAVAEARRRAQQ